MESEKKGKLLGVISALDDCIGVEIPYGLVQRMTLLSRELRAYIQQQKEAEGGEEEG